MKRLLYCHGARFALLLLVATIAVPANAQLWRKFMPSSEPAPQTRNVAATQSDLELADAPRRTTDTAGPLGGEHALSENNGPWLIVAASFSGDGAERQARELADELRGQFRLAAYVHEMSFKFGDENPGKGLDSYGAPTRRHYRRGDQALEIAVLVGDF